MIFLNRSGLRQYEKGISLADTGMDAHLLELEISEGLLMRDVEKTKRIFQIPIQTLPPDNSR